MIFGRWQHLGFALLVMLASLIAVQVSYAGDNQQAMKTVERVTHLFSSKSSQATVKMQIINQDGQRTLEMNIWTLGDKVLVQIKNPPDEAGTAILKVGSNIWYYLPKSHRTVAIPPAMAMTSWMGSDFTIDDLVKETSLEHDYSISLAFEGTRGGVAVDEYTLTPKPNAAVVWGKIVLQIRQADSAPTWQGFYDEDGKLKKELAFSVYKKMSGRLIPTRLVMRSSDKPGAQTTIEYENIVFDAPISADTFSLANLSR